MWTTGEDILFICCTVGGFILFAAWLNRVGADRR